jgi:hypothetical protein
MSDKPPDQMTLVYLLRARQVLAVATRTAVPASAVSTGTESKEQTEKNAAAELKTLVGDQLLVRNLPVTLVKDNPAPPPVFVAIAEPVFVPDGISYQTADLGVATITSKPEVLLNPRSYFIDAKNTAQLTFAPTNLKFSATRSNFIVTLPAPVVKDTGVWVQVYLQGGTEPVVVLQDTIIPTVTPTTIDFRVQLTAGTYQFLTMVQGYAPIIYEKVIT